MENLNIETHPPKFLTYFHKSMMDKVKKECKGVSYIAHEQHAGKYFIKVRVNNNGFKDEVLFPLLTSPNKMSNKEYDFIIEAINNKEYERRS